MRGTLAKRLRRQARSEGAGRRRYRRLKGERTGKLPGVEQPMASSSRPLRFQRKRVTDPLNPKQPRPRQRKGGGKRKAGHPIWDRKSAGSRRAVEL